MCATFLLCIFWYMAQLLIPSRSPSEGPFLKVSTMSTFKKPWRLCLIVLKLSKMVSGHLKTIYVKFGVYQSSPSHGWKIRTLTFRRIPWCPKGFPNELQNYICASFVLLTQYQHTDMLIELVLPPSSSQKQWRGHVTFLDLRDIVYISLKDLL